MAKKLTLAQFRKKIEDLFPNEDEECCCACEGPAYSYYIDDCYPTCGSTQCGLLIQATINYHEAVGDREFF